LASRGSGLSDLVNLGDATRDFRAATSAPGEQLAGAAGSVDVSATAGIAIGVTAVNTTAVDGAVDGARGYDRLRRRRIILLAVVALVVVAAAGALLLTSQIKSPAEQAAQTRPPALTELTAPVQQMVLTTTVLGQAVVGPPKEVSPSAIGGAGGGSGAAVNQNVQPIVTRIFRRSGTVGQGSVLLEVAGQPFFVLQGTVPAYRNLEPGETGPDVGQLQDDMQSLGYSTGADASGVFGSGTSAAVDAFYKGIGYTPQQVSSGPKADRGPVVPLGQYTFVPQLPARIASLSATVGQTVSAGALTLAIGNPTISGQVSPNNARLLRPGMRVTITEPGAGVTIPGRVTSVSQSTASKASVSGGLYVRIGIRPARPLPMSLVGQDVSLTIEAARSNGAVLAVPEAAVFASADGRTYVSKRVGTTAVRVAVQVGISGGGLLQVTPLQPGALTAGDQVITGENYSTGPALQATRPRQ
jgi:peptidoglycan hydrolase-like protein with peptidoglycan-binding domain